MWYWNVLISFLFAYVHLTHATDFNKVINLNGRKYFKISDDVIISNALFSDKDVHYPFSCFVKLRHEKTQLKRFRRESFWS